MNAEVLEERLAKVAASEERFIATMEGLEEAALVEPSLLPGWSRGHVVAHVALNAHSNVNLMNWARTGVETPQYPSEQHRADDIESLLVPYQERAPDRTARSSRYADGRDAGRSARPLGRRRPRAR